MKPIAELNLLMLERTRALCQLIPPDDYWRLRLTPELAQLFLDARMGFRIEGDLEDKVGWTWSERWLQGLARQDTRALDLELCHSVRKLDP